MTGVQTCALPIWPVKCADRLQWVTHAVLIATNTFGNQRRTQVWGGKDGVGAHPPAAVDIAVMGFGVAHIGKFNRKQETQKRRIVRRNPLMHANEVLRLRLDAGLFPQFTRGGLD